MKRLIDSGLVRDVAIFATAAVGIQIAGTFRKPQVYSCFEKFHRLRSSPLARPLAKLMSVLDEAAICEIFELCDSFLTIIENGNPSRDGFNVNRLARRIPVVVGERVRSAAMSSDMQTAIRGMDYQRDELPFIEGVCDGLVRNMLLDARPYA